MNYIHSIPGRLKIKGPEFKRVPGLEEELKSILSHMDGIKDIEYNPATGSIKIYYDPKAVQASTILDYLKEKGVFDHHRALSHDDYFIQTSLKWGKRLGKIISDAAGDVFLSGTPFALLLKVL